MLCVKTLVVAAVLCCASASAGAATNEFKLNGWYPCGTSDAQEDSEPAFECGEVVVPLCHAGVCQSNKDISVFVKRKTATATAEDSIKQALWLLQGGPGFSSSAMEGHMNNYYEQMGGTLSVYTMDHRGTGRSNFLQCTAAQALTAGSPSGYSLNITEYPTCFEDLLFQMDNQTSAFSVTSAAKDLEYLIENLNVDEETYVHGVSYGTFLTLREMHLAPKQVKGYILDGVISEAGPDEDTRMTYSFWDYDVIPTTNRLFEYCRNDTACPLVFADEGTALDQVRANLSSWDNECKQAFETKYAELGKENNAVNAMRLLFAQTSRDMKDRELIAPALARAFRCEGNDQAELTQVLDAVVNKRLEPKDPLGAKPDPIDGENTLLYNLIVFSEQWSVPSPTQDIVDKYHEESLFSATSTVNLQLYCTFTRNVDQDACKGLEIPEGPRFAYEVDEYFNKTAPIPEGTSVLFFNGKLDYQTASEYGVYQYGQMQGEKILVEFDYGGHGVGIGAIPGEDTSCGVQIASSYLKSHGNIDKVDTSCMNNLTAMDFSDATFADVLAQLNENPDMTIGDDDEDDDPHNQVIGPKQRHSKKHKRQHIAQKHSAGHHASSKMQHKRQETPQMKQLRQRLQKQQLLSRFGF